MEKENTVNSDSSLRCCRNRNAVAFAICCLGLVPLFASAAQNVPQVPIAFGNILAAKESDDVPFTIHNVSRTRSASFQIQQPQPPFEVRSGSLSASIAPLSEAVIVFGFEAPPGISNRAYQQNLRVTTDDPQLPQFDLVLSATLVVPTPIDFQKRRFAGVPEIPVELFFYVTAPLTSKCLDVLSVFGLVTFKSSTGKIEDLAGMRIREVITVESCARASGGYLCKFPAPFSQGATINPFVGQASFSWLPISALQYGIFDDQHGPLPLQAPLQEGEVLFRQEYQWTAPWLSESGAPIWRAFGEDRVTRRVYRVGVVNSWRYQICSDKLGAMPGLFSMKRRKHRRLRLNAVQTAHFA